MFILIKNMIILIRNNINDRNHSNNNDNNNHHHKTMTIPMTHLVNHLFASDFWGKAREILARLPRLTDEEKEDTLGQRSSVFLPSKVGTPTIVINGVMGPL